MPGRLLIVDQSLVDFDGHHYEYDLAIAEAAAARGLHVIVGANQRLSRDLAFPCGELRPWFRHAWFAANQAPATRAALGAIAALPPALRAPATRLALRGKRLLSALRPGLVAPPAASDSDFGAALLRLVAEARLTPADHVIVHTLSIPELDSLIVALDTAGPALPRIHIVLRRDAEEPGVAGAARASFAAVAQSETAWGALRFYADTDELAEQHRGLADGLPVRAVPIPHCLPPAPPRRQRSGPTVLSYLGNARREKGFQLLPDLVDALAPDLLAGGHVRFVIQSNFNLAGGEPGIRDACRRLQRYAGKGVELLDRPLPPEQFAAALAASDVLLLPYDRERYRRRSSGLLIQAMAMGCAVVVPTETWLARQPAGSAVAFDAASALPAAVREAVRALPQLEAAAAAQVEAVRSRHNGARLLETFLAADAEDATGALSRCG